MGTIKRGILGGFSGKLGSVVGSSWKGIAVVKKRPLSVAQPVTDRKSKAQIRFSVITYTAKEILSDVIKPLLDRNKYKMSGFNLFSKINKECFTWQAIVKPEDILISVATFSDTNTFTATLSQDGLSILLEWTNINVNSGSESSDELYGMGLSIQYSAPFPVLAHPARNTLSYTLDIPDDNLDPQGYYIYIVWRKANGAGTSETKKALVLVD